MSRVCQFTGKRPDSGNRRSHSNRATNCKRNVNIQKKRVFVDGRWKKIKVAASTLRTMAKNPKKFKHLLK